MTGNDLFREIGDISEEYIAEAQDYQSSKKNYIAIVKNPSFRKMMATAACLVVCAGLVYTVQKMDIGSDSAKESAVENEVFFAEMAAEQRADGAVSKESKLVLTDEAALEESTKDKTISENGSIKDEYLFPLKEAEKEESISQENVSVGKGNEMIMTDAYIVEHGAVKEGQEIWDAFLEQVNAGEASRAKIIRTTVEGDPIVAEVVYDGEKFYLKVDYSKDSFRGDGPEIFEEEYSSLSIEERQTAGGETETIYSLKNDESVYEIVYVVK